MPTHTDLRPLIAANLRAERARSGILQGDLAAAVGLPRATLADVEAGRRRLGIAEAVDLCEALDVGLVALLAGSDDEARRARRVLLGDGHDQDGAETRR